MKSISSGFIIKNNKNEILLGKVLSHNSPNQYTVFKGKVEEGETLLEAAIRELHEEAGIDINSNHRLNKYVSNSPIFSYSMKKKEVVLFLLEDIEDVLTDFEFKCSSYWGGHNPEIDEYAWIPIEEMQDKVFNSQKSMANFLKDRFIKNK